MNHPQQVADCRHITVQVPSYRHMQLGVKTLLLLGVGLSFRSTGSTPVRGKVGDNLSFATAVQSRPFLVRLRVYSKVLGSLCTLKIQCPPVLDRTPSGWWHENTQVTQNSPN